MGYRNILRGVVAPSLYGLAVAGFAMTLALTSPVEAAGPSVGVVTKVQNDGTVTTDGSAISARVGTVVHMQDSVQTGSDSRIEITFRDGTKVTLGENANLVVDNYVYSPDESVGRASLNVTEGAFRFVTGRMNQMTNKDIKVNTTAAQIGVRGTNFWGGMLNEYGVYVFSGAVDVTAQGATVAVPAGQGTFIPLGGVPGAPSTWSAAQIAQALQTISIQPGGLPQQPQYQPQQYEPPQQQPGGQQQTTTTTTSTTATATTTTSAYAVIPVVAGGVLIGAFVWSTSANNDDDDGGRRGPASP